MSVFSALEACRQRGEAAVLVTIMSVEGSAPRGVGTRLLVSPAGVVGTIGGGALEHAALAHARQMLSDDPTTALVHCKEWSLGKALSQCCGGRINVMFDRMAACDFHVEIFGAGHVAQHIATLLRQLPCIATFHDSREMWLERLQADEYLGVQRRLQPDIDLSVAVKERPRHEHGLVRARLHDANVYAAVEKCQPASYYLVMTHSHDRDLEVVEAVLAREDAAFCGLIASRSKARAFRSRLSRKGFSSTELRALTAPLGTHVRTGNTPMEVAIAAVADVLDARNRVAEPAVQPESATPAHSVTPLSEQGQQ